MEKCGICSYITNGFAVFLEANPSEKTGKRVGNRGAYTTRFHGLTDVLLRMRNEKCGYTWPYNPHFWTNQIHCM